jgi:hypothetical protein
MKPCDEISFHDEAPGDVAVLERPETPELTSPEPVAKPECDPHEVRQAIGAVLVRAWVMRRTL